MPTPDAAHDPRRAAHAWIAAWNRHDLDAVMEHYAEDVVFRAATVVTRWNRDDGTLHGRAALRAHFAKGLALAPGLRFELEDVLLAPGGYAVVYRRENGNRVVDAVELDAGGRAVRVHAYY